MNLSNEQYLTAVIKEIENIKKYASDEALNNLEWDTFSPGDIHNCIYGKMHGHCRNTSAMVMIGKCCYRYSTSAKLGDTEIFGKKKDIISDNTIYMSILEAYIVDYPKYNEAIIEYLRGERKTLPKLTLS